jgi:hypothetical protein
VSKVWFARIRLSSGITQIRLGHDPKGSDGRERPAVVAVQLVAIVAVDDDLSFESRRQFKAMNERITRISIPRVITLARIFENVSRVVVRGSSTEFDPMHLEVVTRIVVAIARIVVKHQRTSR